MKTIPIINHENKDLCTSCGGLCCKTTPGFLIPEDITPSLDEGQMLVDMQALLDTGKYMIADQEFEDEDGFYTINYIKPKTVLVNRTIFPVSYWGTCVFHTDQGCALQGINRPYECRILVPNKNNQKCRPYEELTRKAKLQSWRKYQDVLEVIIDLYYDQLWSKT